MQFCQDLILQKRHLLFASLINSLAVVGLLFTVVYEISRCLLDWILSIQTVFYICVQNLYVSLCIIN